MRRAALSVAVLIVLAGCGQGATDESASPTLPPTASASTPAESASADRTNSNGAALNARGNIPKAIGQDAFVTDEAGREHISLAIDAITPDPVCDSGFADQPANGHYVAVDLRVATSPDLPQDWFVSFSADDFRVIGPDGITNSSVAGQGYSCLAGNRVFTYDLLGPGQQYRGTIVLDVPVTTGALAFVPDSLGGTTGWEWEF